MKRPLKMAVVSFSMLSLLLVYERAAHAQRPATDAIRSEVNATPIDVVALDAIVERYGESVPDEFFSPVRAASPESMEPDPVALAVAREAFAQALSRHGFSEKAQRVRRLIPVNLRSYTEGLSFGSPGTIDAPAIGSCSARPTGLLDANCNSSSYFCNQSDTWLMIKGDYYYWSAHECWQYTVGWVGPDQCVGNGWGDWGDVDNIWNCLGNLRVGWTTVGPGQDSWHPRDGSTTTAYDDPSYPNVVLVSCNIGCYWAGCTNCCSQ